VWPTFWTGETGRFLRKAGADAQRVALYLITGPNSTMIGLYHLALPTLCHEVGITEKGALKALARCSEGVFAYYDRGSEGVFVPEMGHYQIGPTLSPKDNRHKAVVKLLEQMRKSPFLKDFMARYAVPYQLPDLSPLQAPCKPLRSQDQEQEQDQEQNTEARAQPKRFVRPTLEDVTAYCQERKNGVSPQAWMNHYLANGWTVGKYAKPMKDWKAAVRTWEDNEVARSQAPVSRLPPKRLE
jgi:hypothetical protein